MSFIEEMKKKASMQKKTIALPEATDVRVIEAAVTIEKEGFAHVVLVGNEEDISKVAKENGFDVSLMEIVNPLTSSKYEEYVNAFYELRKLKGMDIYKARETLKDPVYFGMMMVKQGDCDGLVSGAIHSTADTLRPALQILKTAPRNKTCFCIFCNVCSRL